MASDFVSPKSSPKASAHRFWNENEKTWDVSRQISASVDQGPTGSFHLLQLSREATCWVKPRVTSEHGASWEIQFGLEEMLVGQMSNSMQFCYSWTFSSDAVKRVLTLVSTTRLSHCVAQSLIMIRVKVAATWNISSVAFSSLHNTQYSITSFCMIYSIYLTILISYCLNIHYMIY